MIFYFFSTQDTKVIIHFKDIQFVTPIRSEVYGIMDFIADLGGLFGLFMGFSLLSVVELIYYLTVRPVAMVRKQSMMRKQAKIAEKTEKAEKAAWDDKRIKSAHI